MRQTYVSVFILCYGTRSALANSADQDQTTAYGAVRSGEVLLVFSPVHLRTLPDTTTYFTNVRQITVGQILGL